MFPGPGLESSIAGTYLTPAGLIFTGEPFVGNVVPFSSPRGCRILYCDCTRFHPNFEKMLFPGLPDRFKAGSICCLLVAACGVDLAGAMNFVDVTHAANIRHRHSHESIEAFSGFEHAQLSGGAVAEDFDGNGWMDLYVLQGGDSANLLYMNRGDGTFMDEAVARGAGLTGYHMGACAADYDNDGDIDIFISGASPPHILLVNDGTGHFSANEEMIDRPLVGVTSPSWGDIDNDGLLELALGAWRSSRYPREGDFMQIYRNTGEGRLEPFISLQNSWDYIPRFLDMNNDRRQDFLIVADFGNTRWFQNYGNGIFLPSGQSDIENGMGVATGDIDNDGDLDIFMTSIYGWDPIFQKWTTNRLLLNNGSGEYEDITPAAGVGDGAWGWGAEMADFDNDGDLDIFHVNGWAALLGEETIFRFKGTPARLYENMGENTFQDVASLSGDAADTGEGRCVVVFDYDNDGDEDIFIANNSLPVVEGESVTYEPAPAVLLRNDTDNDNAYLKVTLEGLAAPHHSMGIGARVVVEDDGIQQMRELHASSSFNGQSPRRLAHFGLKKSDRIDRVRALWTTGDVTEIRDVSTNQAISIASPRATVSARVIAPGGSLIAEFPEEALPEDAEAVWSVNGAEYANGSEIILTEPGNHLLVVTITTGEDPPVFIRSETLFVRVELPEIENRSIARIWNEQNLAAIRIDFPDPTRHARNLFAVSVAMWDAWAAFDEQAVGVLHNEKAVAEDVEAARTEAISYAAYRVLSERYKNEVNGTTTMISLNSQMLDLGFDPLIRDKSGDTAAALGNRVAQSVLDYTASDGWNDPFGFLGAPYESVNEPLSLVEQGTAMNDPNRWQPLLFEEAFTQNQQEADLIQEFLGPNWGGVRPFALASMEGNQVLHLDPGPPPQLGGPGDELFKQGVVEVIRFSSLLDPAEYNPINISPASYGNNPLGTNSGEGYPVNPHTAEPYWENIVNHADFGRVLAEFWADGPNSETPPGHWNVLANKLHAFPEFTRRFQGSGSELELLEWDVKVYLALNGALHDAAIAAWGCKRVYDYVRPVSAIRHMGGLGQSTHPHGPSYHPEGLPLVPGLIEMVTPESAAQGNKHEHLSDHEGAVAIRSWSAGNNESPGGVKWILAESWLPYQPDTFVTPAFPGYVSGHSTFSRAAAEVLARITGDIYFPGGLATFVARKDEFLEFEEGPSTDVILQWATYYDAADQAGISRLYGGIHVPADDTPGRILGSVCGIAAWELAGKYFDGTILEEPVRIHFSLADPSLLQLDWEAIRGFLYKVQATPDPLGIPYTDASEWMQAEETLESLQLPMSSGPREFFRIIRSHETR